MGFYFKLAPGVKIRATHRGLRASVGPRAARVHVGAGGTGVSTGAGPVSLYHSVGGGRGRRRATGPSRTSIAAYERQLRQAQKLEQAQELQAAFEGILNLHREDFTPTTAPVAPPPAAVDMVGIRQRHEREALQGLNVFQRSARASARQRAAEAGNREIDAETARIRREHADLQRELDEQWHRLLANDPDVVFATLTEAFEDNEAPAAVAGVHDGEVSVVVMVPDVDAVPERMPRLTEAGNVSLAKLTKSVRNSFYVQLVCGHILVTVREALAVAPAITSVRVAVIRWTSPNAYGMRSIECLLAAVFTRQALHGIQWQSADAATIVQDASAELHIRQGATSELRPLDLSNEPGLAAVLQAVDLEELDGAAVNDDSEEADRHVGSPSSATPPPWRPRPGWGTVRDYAVVANEHGGTDVSCRFIPDDGSEPIPCVMHDASPVAEMGEYARGIMASPGELTIRVSAASMIDAEQGMFSKINAMEPAKRAAMYTHGSDLYEECGWAWTPDYRLVKAAPGLIGR
jgi:hypothetical protein